MSKHESTRKRGLVLIALLVTLLMVTSMACNLLDMLTDDEGPEEIIEDEPVAIQEEEPAQEEPVQEDPVEEIEEPVQEEEEAQEPVDASPATELSGDALYLIEGKQGIVEDEYYTYGVFAVGNPRTDCMYNYAQFDYVAYDANNTELYTDSGYIETALPGGQVLDIIYFPEEAQDADHFDVTLNPGDCVAAPTTADMISVSNQMLIDDEYYPTATAILTNGMDAYQTEIYVGVLAYDTAGQIVGTGSSYVNQLFPNDYTGVEVYLNKTEGAEIASVEFFPSHSYFSETELDTTFFETAYLADQLPWIQIEDQYETVFYVINDDPTNAALDVEYQLTIVDENNNVLSVETGWIDYVLPGDVTPVYISAQLPEGVSAYTHWVELTPGEFGGSPFAENPFTTSNYGIDDSGWTPVVTFDLTNTSDKAVSDVEIVVVLYDADENFIGGGYTYSDIVSGNTTVGQQVNVNVLGEADAVDIYLNIDWSTEIEGWED